MQGYFTDKKAHPWHRLVPELEKERSMMPPGEFQETVLLLRAAVFAALDMLSLAVPIDTPTSEILRIVVSKRDWTSARKEARTHCTGLVHDMIEAGAIQHLEESALRRDGFGFLNEPLEEAKWKQFRCAKPVVRRGALNLEALEQGAIGRRFLKQQGIVDLKLKKGDPLIPQLIEAYEHFLVEYEVDRSLALPSETEQLTLNGSPFEEEGPQKDKRGGRREPLDKSGAQAELTDFIAKDSEPRSSKTKARKKRKKGGRE